MMLGCGIDIGSRTVKGVIFDPDNNTIVARDIADSGAHPAKIARGMLDSLKKASGADGGLYTISTGYGRHLIADADRTITEITCHARGVRHVIKDARTVVDIGGQDSKVIAIGADGLVEDFAMNDRCAAGTGRFLEVIARILDMDVTEIGEKALASYRPHDISSMCVVFAESEVIGLIARETPPEDILAGVHRAIGDRILGLSGKIKVTDPVVFTGGVALNPAMVRWLSERLKAEVVVPEDPQATGALGAAILATRG